MWRLRIPLASRVPFRRSFMLLATTLVVAVFATISLAQPASAIDAIWTGNSLSYDGHPFEETTIPPDRPGHPGETKYQWINATTVSPPQATVIYFAKGDNQYRATTAILITYHNQSGAKYKEPGPPQTITVIRDLTAENTGENRTAYTTCSSEATGSVGWAMCPLSNWIANGVDGLYSGIITDFLEVVTVTNDTSSAIYQLWDLMRTIANVCFIIAFLVIVFSHLTSVGYSNYNLKTVVPRLIVAAVLVNISFWIVALAVDAANLVGHSIHAIIHNIRLNLPSGDSGLTISWVDVVNFVLSAGLAGLGAHAGFAAAAGGSFPSLGFILLAALISAAFAILIAFIILAARQAIITILIIISPLAFVAYVLPNTQSLFDKWRKSLTTLLIFFPVFSLLFGGAQLAGYAIISNADGRVHIVILGLATQVVPLVITPLLIRFSTGLLGQVANIANSKSRGLVDRARNWAHDNADFHKAKKISQHDKKGNPKPMAGRDNLSGFLRPSQLGRRMDYKKRQRDLYKKDYEETANNRAESGKNRAVNTAPPPPLPGNKDYRSRRQRRAYEHRELLASSHSMHTAAAYDKGQLDAKAEEHWAEYLESSDPEAQRLMRVREQTHLAKGRAKVLDDRITSRHEQKLKQEVARKGTHLYKAAVETGVNNKEAALYQSSIDGAANEQWATKQKDLTLRALRTETHHTEGRAKIIDEAMTAADQSQFELLVAEGQGIYAPIRKAKEDTIRDNKHTQLQVSRVEASGNRAFQESVLASQTLRDHVKEAHENTKRAEQAKALIDQEADAHWEELTLSDKELYGRNLQQQRNAKSIKASQQEWESILSEAGAGKTDDYQERFKTSAGPAVPPPQLAKAVQDIQEFDANIAAETFRKERADYVTRSNLNKRLKNKSDPALLKKAGGIDQYGESKVLATLDEEASGLHMANVKAARSVFANDVRYTNKKLEDVYKKGILADGKPASIIERHAAIKRLAEETGNNYAVQDLVAFANDIAMLDDVDASGNPILTDIQGNQLSDEEIETRRDTQQIIRDSVGNSKNKVDWWTGTDQGMAETGRFAASKDRDALKKFAGDELAITREINNGKIDSVKALGSDIDVINKQIAVLANREVREELITQEGAKQYADKLEDFLKDRDTGMRLDKRKRGSYHILLEELRAIAADPTAHIDLPAIDKSYKDVTNPKGPTIDILPENYASAKPMPPGYLDPAYTHTPRPAFRLT